MDSPAPFPRTPPRRGFLARGLRVMLIGAAIALIFSLAFVIAAFRSASFPQRAVAVALVLNTLVGLRDIYAFRFSQDLAGTTYLRYSSVLFGLVLGYIVVTRFRAVAAQAQELMATLAGRVAQKESELAQSYQKLEQVASERARAQERARVLRDMHDGVGAHISSAIRQLESGRSSQAEVLQTLRDSLDQLKLSIDAMNLPQGDITALLANLRYRLEPRFAASDIELQWDVDVMEPVARLDSQGMRHLQFMLFEALSNVLQHAAATVLRIEASATDGGAVLRIVDNGRGFDVTAPPRKGLASQRERASAMGASAMGVVKPKRAEKRECCKAVIAPFSRHQRRGAALGHHPHAVLVARDPIREHALDLVGHEADLQAGQSAAVLDLGLVVVVLIAAEREQAIERALERRDVVLGAWVGNVRP